MPLWNDYHLPLSVDEAVGLLARYDGKARVVAGGTDLILDLRQGHAPPVEALIDVTRIIGLNEIREAADFIVIGAGVTHSQIVESQLLQQKATALVEASYVVGGPQVRNVATLGGNVAHALPAADGTTALNALDAEVEVASFSGRRWIPFTSLFLGPGKSAIDSTREILTALRFKATGENEASAFSRIMRPQGVALPIMNFAAKVRVLDQQIEKVALAVAPVAPTPFRCQQTEAFFMGKPATSESIEAAVEVLLSECKPRTSPHRATGAYRQEVLPVLLRRTLGKAIERVKTGEVMPEIYKVE
ncbi:xanthine dehydrogenase FAD-binding subunit [Thermoflexales bacterium]|nr:xanthine dehydrogenase FAD-binding subunit [Thermoflexales bacterium]